MQREATHGIKLLALVALLAASPAFAGPECVCKANGRDYKEGQTTCILGYLARCEMALNNTSWKKIADDCPEAGLPLNLRLRALHRPKHGVEADNPPG